MLELLEIIVARLLMAVVVTAIWTVASIFISYVWCKILNKDETKELDFSESTVKILTDFILIFICLLLFYREE